MPQNVIETPSGETFDIDAIMAMRFPMDGGPNVMTNRPRSGLRQRAKAFLMRDNTQDPRLLIESLDNTRKPARKNDFDLGNAPSTKPSMDMSPEETEDLEHEFNPPTLRPGMR